MGRTLAQGQVFAGYTVERLLGVGGMGEVYLAQDRDLPRPVALKLLAAAKADDPEVRARFLREADTAARLSHPNIVAVYARGNDEHRLWMAMQYIEGTDVSAVLRDGPLRPDYAVRIIGETARALDHAHRAGVLHRDVKPANILLAWGPDQRVYLADFGIAKAVDHTSALTRTGEMYASFQYAAPEQFELRTDTDHRADVYALGCTLFHMLTGQLPYPGETTAQLVAAHLSAEIPRPSQVNPAVPQAFDQVIARALAKNRDQRFGSCGELAAAAQQALTATPATAGPWIRHEEAAQPQARMGLDPSKFTGATTKPSMTTQRPPSWTAPTQVNAAGFSASPFDSQPHQFTSQPHELVAPPAYGPLGSGPRPVDAPPPPPRRTRKPLIAAFAAVLVVAGGVSTAFGTGALHFGDSSSVTGSSSVTDSSGQTPVPADASQAAATKAACDYGQLVETYDYSDGDAWQTKVEDGATGTWKGTLSTLMPILRVALESGDHTRSTGGKCTVTSGSGTHYEFTASFDLVDTKDGKDTNQRTQTFPMAMDYTDGRWLCSKLTIPGLSG
ncbi:serine/threonine-protein kinase [Nocardia sp. CDC153]|uniref:serine/threonine-protein kinase n=1 Tax=Nocardia sp. CDC153 TaxID=3112167 RepID=UPI002DB5747E|nr:serine/threonine-protein kinase [Nocardia sp. CDC153]MEC3955828.1 serine/threonine-protein kinase [Nocardia sp. CDC153]